MFRQLQQSCLQVSNPRRNLACHLQRLRANQRQDSKDQREAKNNEQSKHNQNRTQTRNLDRFENLYTAFQNVCNDDSCNHRGYHFAGINHQGETDNQNCGKYDDLRIVVLPTEPVDDVFHGYFDCLRMNIRFRMVKPLQN